MKLMYAASDLHTSITLSGHTYTEKMVITSVCIHAVPLQMSEYPDVHSAPLSNFKLNTLPYCFKGAPSALGQISICLNVL